MGVAIWKFAFDACQYAFKLRRRAIVRRSQSASASWNYRRILALLSEQEKGVWRSLYDGYLESEDWHRRRSRFWRSTCGRCGVARSVDMHHLTYDRVGMEAEGDLVAVCRECHEKIHGRGFGRRRNVG